MSIIKQKQGFLLCVYGTLIGQLLFTFSIVHYLRNSPYSSYTNQSIWVYLLVSLALLFLLFVPMPVYAQIIVFTIFSFVEACLLHQVSNLIPEEIVDQVLIGSISIFIGMSIFAVVLTGMNIDISFLGVYLMASLIGLLISSVVVLLFGRTTTKSIYKFLSILGLTLFSVFVMYDTNVMLQSNQKNFVVAAINFYLDFVNIFVNLLSLESSS